MGPLIFTAAITGSVLFQLSPSYETVTLQPNVSHAKALECKQCRWLSLAPTTIMINQGNRAQINLYYNGNRASVAHHAHNRALLSQSDRAAIIRYQFELLSKVAPVTESEPTDYTIEVVYE